MQASHCPDSTPSWSQFQQNAKIARICIALYTELNCDENTINIDFTQLQYADGVDGEGKILGFIENAYKIRIQNIEVV